MAHAQPEIDAVHEQERVAPLRRRRKVMIGAGCLLGIVLVGAATISTMLDHLETRNASFRPPMTSLEREQLLPPEPVLEVKPQVDGLRYGAAIVPPLSPAPLNPSSLGSSETRSSKPLGIAQAIHVHDGAR